MPRPAGCKPLTDGSVDVMFEAVSELARKHFREVTVANDLAGVERVVAGRGIMGNVISTTRIFPLLR